MSVVTEAGHFRGALANGKGEHLDPLPKPETKGMVVKADAKLGEKIELRKGTIFLIGLAPAIMVAILLYGTSIFGIVRDDQTKTLQIQALQSDINSMKEDVKELRKIAQEQQIQNAKATGYTLGVTETQADHGKKVTPSK